MNYETEINNLKRDLERSNASYEALNEEYEKMSNLKSDQAHTG
jgi:predicted  nucleic acid-binding Zn-ribbon protein